VTPGLAIVGLLVVAGFGCHRMAPSVSPLLWAMAFGMLLAPVARPRREATAGVQLAATHLLRAGVALLGLRILLAELAEVGLAGAAIAAGTVAATMLLTTWLGRRIGVPAQLSLLIASGSAICGASAIAAMNAVMRAREEDVGYAVASVTLFGTAAMLLLPVLSAAMGLGELDAGMWAGASIHEVAQATAAGAVISAGALKVATLVKLSRVIMLAAVVAIAGAGGAGGRRTLRPHVPGFVVAFLALVVLRSVVDVPEGILDAATVTSTVLLAAGLAALGLRVRLGALREAGLRPLALGTAASVIAGASGLGLVLLLA
jgi:uncharacterized integral membrane protein (TIGR00698 family)